MFITAVCVIFLIKTSAMYNFNSDCETPAVCAVQTPLFAFFNGLYLTRILIQRQRAVE